MLKLHPYHWREGNNPRSHDFQSSCCRRFVRFIVYLNPFADAVPPEFTKACENASFDLGPILVQTNPPATTTGKKNGVPRVAAVGVSGLAFVCGVTMLLL